MPRYGFRRPTRRRGRKILKGVIQHSPALMGNVPATGSGLLHVLAHATVLAGVSMSTNRFDEDRNTEVANGRNIHNMIVTFAVTPAAATSGYYELGFIKYERSTSVPAIGTDPVPASATIAADGMQNAVRSLSPGYMIKYMQIPVTAEMSTTRSIPINWGKYKKAKVKDGDYFVLLVFNRTGGSATYDIQTRFNVADN